MDISQVNEDMANAMKVAIDKVTDKIIDELQKCIDARGIGDGAYSTKDKEFRNAWEQNLATRVGLTVEGDMHYEPKLMSLDPDNFIHGSRYYSNGDDEREYLDDIIFEGLAGDFFGEGYWRQPRDAWQDMLNEVEPKIDSWLDEEMAKQGFTSNYSFNSYHG